jgi:hypothetical protein
MKQLTNTLSKNYMRMLCVTLVHYLYCCYLHVLVWVNAGNTATYTAPSSFRNGHCVLPITLIYNGHTDPLRKASIILKLDDKYEHQALLFLFDHITNKPYISFPGTLTFNRDKPE